MTDQKTINAYNENANAYSGRMRSGKNYAHTYIEKPAMSFLLDEITNSSLPKNSSNSKKILLLGCGSGEEIDLLRSKGFLDENIIGIDISSELIKIAQMTYPEVEFHVLNIEDLSIFPSNNFDIVYSSLVLHYIEDWTKVLNEISRVLKKSGDFIFSTHHPIFWGSEVIAKERDNFSSHAIGYKKFYDKNHQEEIYGNYLTKVDREANWFANSMKIKFYNRSISEMFLSFKKSNFKVENFLEPKPLDEVKNLDSNFWKRYSEIPIFCVWRIKNNH